MIKNILTSRKTIYAFQVLVFAWACASTIYISLNMFLWLLNGIFLGMILYSHHIKNDISLRKNWIKLYFLVTKTLMLLKLLMESYSKILKIVSKNVPLSETERDNLMTAEADLIDHISNEITKIEAMALTLKTKNEATDSNN